MSDDFNMNFSTIASEKNHEHRGSAMFAWKTHSEKLQDKYVKVKGKTRKFEYVHMGVSRNRGTLKS